MGQTSIAPLALATVILGGIGTVLALGATEGPHTNGLLLAGALAVWAFLAVCWAIALRQARYDAWARARMRYDRPRAPASAFWKGAGVGLLIAVGVAVWGNGLMLRGGTDQARGAGGVLVWLLSSWGVIVLPLLCGAIWGKVVATRIPGR